MTDSIVILHAEPRGVPPRLIGLRMAHVAAVAAAALLLALIALAAYAVPRSPGGPMPSERRAAIARPIGAEPIAAPDVATLYDPRDIKPLSAPAAIAANAAVPVAGPVGVGAAAFAIEGSRPELRTALQCLTTALYYEAASESDDGQRAVAQVVLNRMRHPAYPASVCGVVYQGSTRTTGCQFSFTCDGSLARTPSATGWARSRALAEAALSGRVYAPVGHATHYHADYVVPYWAPTLDKLVQVGRHIFYRWTGRAGRAGSFNQRYARAESVPTLPTVGAPETPQDDQALAEALEGAPAAPEAVSAVDAAAAEIPAVPAPTKLEEDRRAAPRLLADVQAGRLRRSLGGSAGASTAREREDESPRCVQSRRAAPVRPVQGNVPHPSDAPTDCS